MFAAAGEAGGFAAEGADAFQFLRAGEAAVEMAGLHLAAGQREGVAALFIVQAEVAAGLLPFGAVRGDAAASGAEVREEMRELVAQRAIHFVGTEIAEARIEGDERLAGERGAGGAAHARVPADADAFGKSGAMMGEKELAGALFESGGAIGSGCRLWRCEPGTWSEEIGKEIELAAKIHFMRVRRAAGKKFPADAEW